MALEEVLEVVRVRESAFLCDAADGLIGLAQAAFDFREPGRCDGIGNGLPS